MNVLRYELSTITAMHKVRLHATTKIHACLRYINISIDVISTVVLTGIISIGSTFEWIQKHQDFDPLIQQSSMNPWFSAPPTKPSSGIVDLVTL